MNEPSFELVNVSKQYGGVLAAQNVSLRFPAGTHTAMLGPSGSGKSTLLRLLAGLESPTSGDVLQGGKQVSVSGRVVIPPHKRGVAMVFQDLALWPNLTVRENIRLGLAGQRHGRQEATGRVREAIDLCGIGECADRRPGQLSGGQQQRAALARAIAVHPRFLFLDEPFSGVDLETKSRILTEIAKLASVRQFTVILVSHDPWEAIQLCSDAIILDNGRVKVTGHLHELLTSCASEPLRSFRQLQDAYSSIAGRTDSAGTAAKYFGN